MRFSDALWDEKRTFYEDDTEETCPSQLFYEINLSNNFSKVSKV